VVDRSDTGDDDIVDAYLTRLGVEREPSSVEALFAIHRAHVDRVPYETTWIALGERWTVESAAAMERIARRGRGGYCFHLNGSLALLLGMLGYDVSRHVGGVHGPDDSNESLTNHLVLLVDGLPADDNPSGTWYVDVGLGDALYEPLPLRPGSYAQTPMQFALEQTPDGVADWHFVHDPDGSFPGMNFFAAVATIDDFADRHLKLSTSPQSGFVKTPTAQRRNRTSAHAVRGLTRSVRDEVGTVTTFVTDRREWFDLLADEYFLHLQDVSAVAKDRLWARAVEAHEAWLATQ
jgi:arylamine N-acetyltransferase